MNLGLNLNIVIGKIVFLWKSKNQHAVHSPFVYSVITKCFYDTKHKEEYDVLLPSATKEISPKKAKLLFRIAHYYKPEKMLLIGAEKDSLSAKALWLANKNAELYYETNCRNVKENGGGAKYELIYFYNYTRNELTTQLNVLLSTRTNETLWILHHIHSSPERELMWNEIKSHSEVVVTIDIYTFGLAFFRTEQAKEHFIIRV